MKKMIFTFCAMTFTLVNVFAQNKKEEAAEAYFIKNQIKTYQYALNNGDYTTAIASLNSLAQTSNGDTYKDSLAYVYAQMGQVIPAGVIAKERFEDDNSKTDMLEILAFAYKQGGNTVKAIESFQQLFERTNDMNHGYELALLQFSITRLQEALASTNKALQSPEIENATVSMKENGKVTQEVPTKAALLNLQGMVLYKLDNMQAAANAFENALKLFPEFTAAKQNKVAVYASIEAKKQMEQQKTQEDQSGN